MTTACVRGAPPHLLRTCAWQWVVVGAWLASTALGFWYFQLRDQRAFESNTVTLFDANSRVASAEAWYRANFVGSADTRHVSATVVHIYRAGCACNRFTEPHLARIMARYRQEGVRFVVATREQSTAHAAAIGNLPQYTFAGHNDLDWLDSAPAALVYDSAGKLVYFGPYSSAAWCGAAGGLIERILDRLLAGQTPQLQPFYGTGCFCPTRTRDLGASSVSN